MLRLIESWARHLVGRLCGGDLDREVRIDVWDEDSVSSADQIGLAKFPVKSLLLKQPIVLSDYKVAFDRAAPLLGCNLVLVLWCYRRRRCTEDPTRGTARFR